jgi:hypothetical protein
MRILYLKEINFVREPQFFETYDQADSIVKYKYCFEAQLGFVLFPVIKK